MLWLNLPKQSENSQKKKSTSYLNKKLIGKSNSHTGQKIENSFVCCCLQLKQTLTLAKQKQNKQKYQ